MRSCHWPSSFLFLLPLLASPAAGAILYSADTGSYSTAIGVAGGGTLSAANYFVTVPGGESITAIQIYWYPENVPIPVGTPMAIHVWSDPDGDGTPDDAVSLAEADVLTGSGWVTYALPEPVNAGPAGTGFFAGFVIAHSRGQHPLSADSGPFANATWLSLNDDIRSAVLLSTYIPWNAMIRAVGGAGGESPIPEPGTAALVAASLAGLGALRRLKR